MLSSSSSWIFLFANVQFVMEHYTWEQIWLKIIYLASCNKVSGKVLVSISACAITIMLTSETDGGFQNKKSAVVVTLYFCI